MNFRGNQNDLLSHKLMPNADERSRAITTFRGFARCEAAAHPEDGPLVGTR